MKYKNEKDYSQKLILEMKEANIHASNQATRAFVDCFSDGDSVEAWRKFEAMACHSKHFDPNDYVLLIFADGSAFCDWMQGIDRFFPNGWFLSTKPSDPQTVGVGDK